MINALTIQNMRCFDTFSVEGMGQITLISGQNNVGKSTILESIYILFAYYRPDILIRLNAIRGISLTFFSPDLLWEPLFHKLDTKTPLMVSCRCEDGTKSISLFRDEDLSFSTVSPVTMQSSPLKMLPLQPDMNAMISGYPLKMVYKDKTTENICHWLPQGYSLNRQWNEPVNQYASNVHYISTRMFETNNTLAQMFGKVELSNKKDVLLNAVKLLDDTVTDIVSVMMNNNTYIYCKKHSDIPLNLPITAMGDGICRLITIICAMIAYPCSILLVDEIENGFHHSFYDALWRVIQQVSMKTQSQVILTSHSYECIQSAVKILNKEDSEHIFRYIRLDKNDDGSVRPKVFSPQALDIAIESEMEIR